MILILGRYWGLEIKKRTNLTMNMDMDITWKMENGQGLCVYCTVYMGLYVTTGLDD